MQRQQSFALDNFQKETQSESELSEALICMERGEAKKSRKKSKHFERFNRFTLFTQFKGNVINETAGTFYTLSKSFTEISGAPINLGPFNWQAMCASAPLALIGAASQAHTHNVSSSFYTLAPLTPEELAEIEEMDVPTTWLQRAQILLHYIFDVSKGSAPLMFWFDLSEEILRQQDYPDAVAIMENYEYLFLMLIIIANALFSLQEGLVEPYIAFKRYQGEKKYRENLESGVKKPGYS